MSVLNARFNKKKGEKPRVLLLYCTCNDFNAEALETCMRQRYEHFHTVILDDSKDEEYKRKIDEFAQTHDVTVVRRENRVGFKAGNLNNYLQGRTDYDYFVVLDSDERIPENYITEVHKLLNSPKYELQGSIKIFTLVFTVQYYPNRLGDGRQGLPEQG